MVNPVLRICTTVLKNVQMEFWNFLDWRFISTGRGTGLGQGSPARVLSTPGPSTSWGRHSPLRDPCGGPGHCDSQGQRGPSDSGLPRQGPPWVLLRPLAQGLGCWPPWWASGWTVARAGSQASGQATRGPDGSAGRPQATALGVSGSQHRLIRSDARASQRKGRVRALRELEPERVRASA